MTPFILSQKKKTLRNVLRKEEKRELNVLGGLTRYGNSTINDKIY